MSTPSIPVTRRPRAPNPQLSDGYLADLRWAGCLRGASATGSWPCGTLRRRAVRTNVTWCWAYWGTRLVPGRLQLDPRIGHGPLSPSWDGGGPQLGVVRVASVSVHSELGGCGAKYHRRRGRVLHSAGADQFYQLLEVGLLCVTVGFLGIHARMGVCDLGGCAAHGGNS